MVTSSAVLAADRRLGGPGNVIPALAFGAMLLAGATTAADLALDLEASKPAFSLGEPVVVRAVLRNPHDAERGWYVKPGFWPVPSSYPMDGDLALRVEVVGPDGNALVGTPQTVIVVRMRTEPFSFTRLRPGAIMGEELVLTGPRFGYVFKTPGTFRVTVTIDSDAPRWFDAWRRRNPEERSEYTRDQLFKGPLANSMSIIVKATAAQQRDEPDEVRNGERRSGPRR